MCMREDEAGPLVFYLLNFTISLHDFTDQTDHIGPGATATQVSTDEEALACTPRPRLDRRLYGHRLHPLNIDKTGCFSGSGGWVSQE
jgi:hypothetical protein